MDKKPIDLAEVERLARLENRNEWGDEMIARAALRMVKALREGRLHGQTVSNHLERHGLTDSGVGRHAFVGRTDRWCEVCNKPDRDPIHARGVDNG